MRISKEAVLGFLFLTGIAALAIATIALTEFSIRKKPRLTAFFEDAKFLKKGDPVYVTGVRAGRVKSVSYDPEGVPGRRVTVVSELDKAIVLREGYAIEIMESTLLGGRVVSIEPGLADRPEVASRSDLRGSTRPEPLAALADLIDENSTEVRRILLAAASTVERIDRGEGSLGRLLKEDSLYKDVAAAARGVRDAVDDARAGRGTIGKLLSEEGLYTDAKAAVSGMRSIVDGVQRGEGSLGALVKRNDLHDSAVAVLEDAKAAASSIRSVTARVDAGEGTIGKLLRDAALYDTWNRVGQDVSSITTMLREGKGTLGGLLNDEQAWKDLKAALKSVARQIEDARESAPIATFAGVLFGVL